ncbi:MarR family winged helix-turn-helix transcriptional regulator [Chryseobacterium sp. M5]|uniref:MarR family winged helix-turn-helix transcriptional regulator n=1 Tax=Chryseobacterium sp. M5 TaxID=3379128 RepID=UPI003857E42A
MIEKNCYKKQTRTQIIKRLLEAGFLEEKNDEDDKRSKRLNLTKKGEEIFHASVSNVNLTSKILCGKLDDTEKSEFLKTLKKLNEFHSHLYADYKSADIGMIIKVFG